MVQRTAEVSVRQDECSAGGGTSAGSDGGPSHSRQARVSNDRRGLRCPVKQCGGLLNASENGYSFHTGLETWVCSDCGHRALRSREGVISLFRSGHEFKFSYGPSTRTITVVLSSASINLWGTHEVSEEQLAKMAAEWTLLCGNTKKPVHLGLPSEEFADCYLYFCGE